MKDKTIGGWRQERQLNYDIDEKNVFLKKENSINNCVTVIRDGTNACVFAYLRNFWSFGIKICKKYGVD